MIEHCNNKAISEQCLKLQILLPCTFWNVLLIHRPPSDFYVPENLEEILTAYYQEVNPEKVSGVYPLFPYDVL